MGSSPILPTNLGLMTYFFIIKNAPVGTFFVLQDSLGFFLVIFRRVRRVTAVETDIPLGKESIPNFEVPAFADWAYEFYTVLFGQLFKRHVITSLTVR